MRLLCFYILFMVSTNCTLCDCVYIQELQCYLVPLVIPNLNPTDDTLIVKDKDKQFTLCTYLDTPGQDVFYRYINIYKYMYMYIYTICNHRMRGYGADVSDIIIIVISILEGVSIYV